MITVGALAKKYGLSRTALLYYEKEGLLSPGVRGENGYRYYGEADEARLKRILGYRSFGLSLSDIKHLLQDRADHAQLAQTHFLHLEEEIQKLRRQQLAVVNLLQHRDGKDETMSVERWTELMERAGLNDDDMIEWHRYFENTAPEDHHRFLDYINCPDDVRANLMVQIRD